MTYADDLREVRANLEGVDCTCYLPPHNGSKCGTCKALAKLPDSEEFQAMEDAAIEHRDCEVVLERDMKAIQAQNENLREFKQQRDELAAALRNQWDRWNTMNSFRIQADGAGIVKSAMAAINKALGKEGM